MEKIKWGILSTAKIGLKQVIPAMQAGEFTEVNCHCFQIDGES